MHSMINDFHISSVASTRSLDDIRENLCCSRVTITRPNTHPEISWREIQKRSTGRILTQIKAFGRFSDEGIAWLTNCSDGEAMVIS
jgi:hypothetical protein